MTNKRKRSKYPGLDKQVNLKIRAELIDHDYLHKLNDKELEWLSNFNEEYISGNFAHGGKRVHKKKTRTKTYKSSGRKVKVDIAKNDAETRNNKRNADIYSREVSKGLLKGEGPMKGRETKHVVTNKNEQEDAIIEMLDSDLPRDDD